MASSEGRDGGPAFPCSNEQFTYGNPQAGDAWAGMTLRDWFAGQALPAVIANCKNDSDALAYKGDIEAFFAVRAYSVADAMLAARSTKDTPL